MRDVIYVKLDIVYSINHELNETISRKSDLFESLVTQRGFVHYQPNGNAFWISESVFRIACAINIKYYPFDIQTIFLGFYSKKYGSTEVKLYSVNDEADVQYYIKIGEWDLIRSEALTIDLGGWMFQVNWFRHAAGCLLSLS